MNVYDFTPEGVCSKNIRVYLAADGTVDNIEFVGGCHGNLQGIAAMARGMRPAEVAERLRGIRCRDKATSCPDQLAKALEQL